MLRYTNANNVSDLATNGSADKLAIIERAIGDCARRLVMLAQEFMTGEQAVRLVGKGSEQMWINFDRDYIKGEFDFEVEGGSTQPVNESFRRQMAMQVVDAMAPFAGAGIIDMPKLATYVLQYGFGIKSASGFITQPPPPPEPQMAPAPQEQMPPEAMPPQGLPPEAMMQGMPPQGDMGGLPPELASLPPELLQQLLQGGGNMPPGM